MPQAKGDRAMLRHEEYENLCRSLKEGAKTQVKHVVTHQVGRIISCSPDDFIEVELANGEHKSWSKDNITVLH